MDRINVEFIKRQYLEGTRLKLIHMDDPFPVESGMTGSVEFVDDAGHIHVRWDNGRCLAVIPGADVFETI